MRIVDETHIKRGGHPPVSNYHPVARALSKMKREGQADNPRQGHWTILLTTKEDDSVDSDHDNLNSENLEPEKIIGSGKQSVYLYYYPAYQRLAELQDKAVWACKVGRSRSGAISRIGSQTRTALPEFPKVGLLIKTDESNLMEKTIQNILRLQGRHKQDAPGKEWFITSPSEVERVYESILGYLQ